jgi:hypothetical protein
VPELHRLSLSETKERVKAALVAAMDDWSHPSSDLIDHHQHDWPHLLANTVSA